MDQFPPAPYWSMCGIHPLKQHREEGVLWELVHIFMAKTRERIIHQQQGLADLWRLRHRHHKVGKKHGGFFKARLVLEKTRGSEKKKVQRRKTRWQFALFLFWLGGMMWSQILFKLELVHPIQMKASVGRLSRRFGQKMAKWPHKEIASSNHWFSAAVVRVCQFQGEG